MKQWQCVWWALVAATWALGGAGGAYCPRADPARRAYAAPLLLEARVTSVGWRSGGGRGATLHVRRQLRPPPASWPPPRSPLRLLLDPPPPGCRHRLEVPLRNGRSYIVFAERRGNQAHALGPPMRKTKKLMRRIKAVFAPKYPRSARVVRVVGATAAVGGVARLECEGSARPPPLFAWYRDLRPLPPSHRHRILTYRRRSVLVISGVRVSDGGRYECRAQGVVGALAAAATNLTVMAVPATTAPAPRPSSTHPPPPTHTPYHRTHHKTHDPSSWGAPCPMPDPSSYCLNGGTCLFFEQVREPACKCPEGFNGQRCENKDITNSSSHCQTSCDTVCLVDLSSICTYR